MFELTKNKVQGMIKNTRAALKIELLDFDIVVDILSESEQSLPI